jgi:hypothetical protein
VDLVTTRLTALAAIAFMALTMGTAQAGPVSGQGTWETTLESRDRDGDGVADAFCPSGNSATVKSSGVNTHH